ncbi:MAG: hypothetical protein V2I33_18785 [Kangiellaceae bacterium]|nr:hypothetical protein [Kangiellaceae bacterium]
MTTLKSEIKSKAFDIINEYLEKNNELIFTWNCNFCKGTHEGNLLKKVSYASTKHRIKGFRPDIYFFNNENKVFAVIRFTLSNSKSKKAIDICKKENIILIEYYIDSNQDYENLIDKIRKPDNVEFCMNPKCNQCKSYLQTKVLQIIDGQCWKCENLTKVALITNSSGGNIRGHYNFLPPSFFTHEEIQIAKSFGLKLEIRNSKTAESNYLGNICKTCDSLIGNFYLFTEYFSPASYGELESEYHDIGFFCEKCDELKADEERNNWTPAY